MSKETLIEAKQNAAQFKHPLNHDEVRKQFKIGL